MHGTIAFRKTFAMCIDTRSYAYTYLLDLTSDDSQLCGCLGFF